MSEAAASTRTKRNVAPPIETSIMNLVLLRPLLTVLLARIADAEAMAAVAAGFGTGVVEYWVVMSVDIMFEVNMKVGVAVEVIYAVTVVLLRRAEDVEDSRFPSATTDELIGIPDIHITISKDRGRALQVVFINLVKRRFLTPGDKNKD